MGVGSADNQSGDVLRVERWSGHAVMVAGLGEISEGEMALVWAVRGWDALQARHPPTAD